MIDEMITEPETLESEIIYYSDQTVDDFEFWIKIHISNYGSNLAGSVQSRCKRVINR